MNSKKENVDWDIIKMIEDLKLENKTTRFVPLLLKHLANIKKYIAFKDKGASVFPDKKAYESFAASCLFYSNLKSHLSDSIFPKNDESTSCESFFKDESIPSLESFYYTDDEREMHKNRIFETMKDGDVLNLKVVDEEGGQFVLRILNKYGEKKRLVDHSLFAVLIKDSPLVKEIHPRLQISDFLRAVVFGTTKQEEGTRKLVVSINPCFIKDKELKTRLQLGRIFKKDIQFYPEDMSGYKSFAEFLDATSAVGSSRRLKQHMSAFNRDPVQTSAILDNPDAEELLVRKVPKAKKNEVGEKLKKIEEILNKGDLTRALFKINEVLEEETFPEMDTALTTRGKIYLAMAGGKPSSKVEKAMMDFEAALKINSLNKEAAAFRDSVIMVSIRRFSQNNTLDKANKLKTFLTTSDNVIASAEAFLENVMHESEAFQTASNAADAPLIVKQEPMNV